MNQMIRAASKSMMAVAASLLVTAGASASVLTGHLSIDNGYEVYVSTDNTVAGTSFGVGADWMTTFTASTTLAAGTDYYLHIRAYDQGGVAAVLGEFSLSAGHHFADGSTALLTNTSWWTGNESGFGSAYGALTDEGANGVGPWGVRPDISADAHWIWAGDPNSNDVTYLSARILADQPQGSVPEPATVALLGLGLLGLAGLRRRPDRPEHG